MWVVVVKKKFRLWVIDEGSSLVHHTTKVYFDVNWNVKVGVIFFCWLGYVVLNDWRLECSLGIHRLSLLVSRLCRRGGE